MLLFSGKVLKLTFGTIGVIIVWNCLEHYHLCNTRNISEMVSTQINDLTKYLTYI